MPDIKFYCPKCQSKLAVDDSVAGYLVDCPHCQTRIRIPNESTVEPPRVELPSMPAAPAELGATQRLAVESLKESAGANLSERIRQLEQERAQIEETLRAEQTRNQSASRLESKVAELLQQIETANAAQQMAETNSRRIIKEKHDLQEKVRTLTASVEEKEKAASEAAAQAETAAQENARLASALAGAEKNSAARQEQVARLESAAQQTAVPQAGPPAEWEQSARKLEAEINGLSSRLTDSDRSRAQAQEEARKLRDDMQAVSREKSKLEEAIAYARRETDNIRSRLEQAEQLAEANARLQARLDELEKEHGERKAPGAALVSFPARAPIKAPPKLSAPGRAKGAAPLATAQATAPPVEAARPPALTAPAVAAPGQREEIAVTEITSKPVEEKSPAAPAAPAAAPRRPMPALKSSKSPRPVPAGNSMYRKSAPGRKMKLPGRRAIIGLAAAALLIVGIALIAVLMPDLLQTGLTRVTALISGGKAATPEGASPAETAPPAPPTEPTVRRAEEGLVLALNDAVLIDGIKVTVRGAKLDRISRLDPAGEEVNSDQPYLVLDMAMQNSSPDKSMYLLHTWEQSTLTDDLQNVLRPAFPSRFSVDKIVGTLAATELAPGQELQDLLIFEAPAGEATRFVLVSDPGFWLLAPDGGYSAASKATFKVSFTRDAVTE